MMQFKKYSASPLESLIKKVKKYQYSKPVGFLNYVELFYIQKLN